ncbi:MAG: S-methyl-5-thioribose-1-phosphate isomerase [Phycisphaerae bacterium]|jgi:methylthioribose-1-phosphate isomerase|nr:S-methyl-5-thioribose-1-phosphate isomerase [Phycisphaerae bacterium]
MKDEANNVKNILKPEDIKPPAAVAEWVGDCRTGVLRLLDQTLLPEQTVYIDCKDTPAVWEAIRRLAVRGAPAIGVAAAYGMVTAAQNVGEDNFLDDLAAQGQYLVSSRPTAVNLEWAVNRIMALVRGAGQADPAEIRRMMLEEARAIHAEDQAMCLAIGLAAAPLIRKVGGVLTHCNAGALATGGIGTATAGMYVAHAAGHEFTVYCDETRPLLQGSRLTAWELNRAGIDAVVITDNMSAQVMREGKVAMVITGADRIAANGDAANKIGTYGVAIAARHHGIPFYVAAPYSTFDLDLPSGDSIPIELRGSEEITEGFGRRTAPHDIKTYSPAFDVTPAELITAIITDRGVIDPVNTENVSRIVGP